MRYCHECGAELAPTDFFCPYCGAAQAAAVVAPSAPTVDWENSANDLSIPQEHKLKNADDVENQTDSAIDSAMNYESSAAVDESDSEDIEPETVLRRSISIPDITPENEAAEASAANEDSPENENENQNENKAEAGAPLEKPENKFSDDDLPPTIIGQSANLTAPENVSSEINNDSPGADKNAAVSQIAADDFTSAESADADNSSNAKEINEAPSETSAVGDVPPSLNPPVKSSLEVPRFTESNKAQETPGGKSPKLKPLGEGTVLNNRYEVLRRIGGGGMGAVYLAADRNLGGVQRAVKEMIQAYVDESQQEKAVQDFRRESILLTQLDHNSIPTIYDYFYDEANGRFYLVMKYIAGGDLAARMRSASEGKLDEGSVTQWSMQIADVLDYLHNRQPPIVYRDLKPSNIMLDANNGKAMLIDFGIARWVNKEEKGVTAVGTMGYAPPELFAGNAEPRSDIYSLGATMFHLLTGADPQSNPLLIFDFTKNPRPRQVNPMLSVEMEDILLRAVEYNAGLRFESAAAMRDALANHLAKLKNGRLTFERKATNIAQVMPIPAQAPPPVPFAAQPQVNMVFCGFCGEKIIATDMFCAYCGAPQNAQPAAGQSPTINAPSAAANQFADLSGRTPGIGGAVTARLVVLGTADLDAPSFNLEKPDNLVGREDRRANIFPEIDLSKFDNKAQVSRRHARIWREGEKFLVADLQSSNGTVLIADNEKTVRLQANQPHVLQHGDKLKLGETILRFYLN